jgi:hypothetical protein
MIIVGITMISSNKNSNRRLVLDSTMQKITFGDSIRMQMNEDMIIIERKTTTTTTVTDSLGCGYQEMD